MTGCTDCLAGRLRKPEENLTQRHMDVAASIQNVLDDVVLRLTRAVAKETGQKNLCLAGGMALNCVSNDKVLRDGRFDRIWIQSASGDAGGALGAALADWYTLAAARRRVSAGDSMEGGYLGPEFHDAPERLRSVGARFRTLGDDGVIRESVEALRSQKALGWFQGRMEFGPRALGGRSILGDPRSKMMQSSLNLKVKYRESFRPFAPSVLREHVSDWFELYDDSPYMLLVADVVAQRRREMTQDERNLFGIDELNVPRSEIPAVTHMDYSARIQTVHRETNPRYHAEFYRQTGCPLLVNTSFNVRGEPIVCTPEDAFRCFMGTEIEALAIGNCFLTKSERTVARVDAFREQFALD